MKCGPGFKKGIGFKQYGGTDRKYLIANGVLQVAAPVFRRRVYDAPNVEYWIYMSTSQNQVAGAYRLYANTSQSLGWYKFHAFAFFQGLDLSKYKQIVITTKYVAVNPSETYKSEIYSGVPSNIFVEENQYTLPTMTPAYYQHELQTSGLVTKTININTTGSLFAFQLVPNYSQEVCIDIVDLYLVEK